MARDDHPLHAARAVPVKRSTRGGSRSIARTSLRPELCRYHACIPCDAAITLATPLFRGRMPEGRYAVFAYEGPVSGLDEFFGTIYSCWFPESALTPGRLYPVSTIRGR